MMGVWVLLPRIDTQRAPLCALLLVGALGMASIATTCEAVEITNSTIFVEPIINGESACAWSPDGSRVMLAELHKADQRSHLCIYSATSRKKEKCIYFLQPQPDLGIHSIDWSDAYIHVAVGFHDTSVIFRLPVPDWGKPDYKEVDLEKFKPLPETHFDPTWDKWADGLFFTGRDERYGIQFLSKGRKPRKYVSGAYPAVTRNYLWYSSFGNERDLKIDGISRVDKATRKQSKLTNNNDVFVSPRQDEKAALFIRREPGTSKTALYAYVDGKGVIGPLLSGNQKIGEELKRIQLSPDGKQALLTSSSEHEADKLKAVVTIRLLSVRW